MNSLQSIKNMDDETLNIEDYIKSIEIRKTIGDDIDYLDLLKEINDWISRYISSPLREIPFPNESRNDHIIVLKEFVRFLGSKRVDSSIDLSLERLKEYLNTEPDHGFLIENDTLSQIDIQSIELKQHLNIHELKNAEKREERKEVSLKIFAYILLALPVIAVIYQIINFILRFF